MEYYNSQLLGINAHAGTIWTFNDIFDRWLKLNGLTRADLIADERLKAKTQENSKLISNDFKGLPCIVPVPIIRFMTDSDGGYNIGLSIEKTEWYGTMLALDPSIDTEKPYLINYDPDAEYDWLISSEEHHDVDHRIVWTGLTLWQVSSAPNSNTVTFRSKVFSLANTTDVEKLLSCYLQLREINCVQILDIRQPGSYN